jgi:predicted Fe-Mo cluster-binding NifX family protein
LIDPARPARGLLLLHFMKVLLSTTADRISPVLDAANCFSLVIADRDGGLIRQELHICDAHPAVRARRIAELGAEVLICGAISWPLEAMLTAAGMRVIPNTCGPVAQVAAAFFAGDLTAQAFLLPGCPGRQHRYRHHRRRRWHNG